MAVNLHTTQYRFGIDELAESTHGWYAAQNTNPTANAIGTGKTFLLRFNVQETGGTAAGNTDFRFRVALNGGSFQDITTSSTIVKAVDPAAWADAANCTQRVAGTGTFEASGAGCTIDGLSGGAANDIAASGCSETECGLQIVAADVKVGDTITFALTSPDFTITNDVVPTLTFTATPESTRETATPPIPHKYVAPRNQNILSIALNLLQSTLAPLADTVTQLRGAIFSNPLRRQWRPESIFAVGLLLTTLASANPFVQRAWPNPTAPARSTALLTWINPPLETPTAQRDWPNPSLGPTRSKDLSTWIQGPSPDSIPNTDLPLHKVGWPVPRGPARGEGYVASILPILEPASGDLPAGKSVQALPPRGPRHPINLLTWVAPPSGQPAASAVEDLPSGKSAQDLPTLGPKRSLKLLSWLQVPGQNFGPPPPYLETNWPVPQQPIRRAGHIEFLSLPRITPAAEQPPGNKVGWLVPQAPARPLRNLTWLQGPRELFPQSPLRPEVIPNPRAVPRLQPQTWVHSAPLALGIPVQSENIPAGTQYDFPNPQRLTRSINLLSFVGRVAGEPGAPQTGIPDGKQTEWLVPKAPDRNRLLRTFLAGVLSEEDTVPASQTEWPNPKIPARAFQWVVGSNVQALTTPPPEEPPFPRQRDWPNPTLQYRSSELRTWTRGTAAPLDIPVEAPPAGQISHTTDFPVPRGAARAASLLVGWIDSNRIANEIPPPPPPGVGYYDIWHYYTGL